MAEGWIGVDLDGTLAEYHGWPPDGSIGIPVIEMVSRVRRWLAEGVKVKIFTARVCPDNSPAFAQYQRALIQDWCEQWLGQRLDVTCQKDFAMVQLWDDRAIRVQENTGKILG